jgi:MiaB/RimO family radical SAM methylthiotransferase
MKPRPQDGKASPWKFYLATFGCKVNQYESQALREAWEGFGGTECDRPEDADIICVNSCAVTAGGERDARNAVFRCRRAAPAARLILTGCAVNFWSAPQTRRRITPAFPDIFVPQEQKKLLLLTDPRCLPIEQPTEQARNRPAGKSGAPAMVGSFPPFRINAFKRARPVVKVQDGCSHRCTYCIVPRARGPATSRAPGEILAEILRLFAAGHAEIMLSGINLNQYGRDKPDYGDFWDLARGLEKHLAADFAGRARLRISSLEPSQITGRGLDNLLDILSAGRMFCPHLHLSLQHASPAVLKRMGRGHYSAQQVIDAVTELKKIRPTLGLGADILVGFPGETERDISILTDFIAKLPFSYAHVFPWSKRPDTPAAGFDGQIPVSVRQARAAEVRQVADGRRSAFLQDQLALKRMLIAADAPSVAKPLKGVNEFYIPCVFRQMPAWSSGLIPAAPTGMSGKNLLVKAI